MVNYTKEQYIQAIKSFNKKNLEGKLNTIAKSSMLRLGFDNGQSWVEIVGIIKELEEEIKEIDWFEWDAEFFTSSEGLFLLLNMAGLL